MPTKTATEQEREAEVIALRAEVDRLTADVIDARTARDAALAAEATTASAIVREMPPYDPNDRPESVVTLLARASGLVGAVPKDTKMEGRGGGDTYMYRGIESITTRAQPVFAQLGLAIVPHRCVELVYEEISNARGTKGRHYLGKWRWRIYGPAGDFIELEAPGECAEWGGDKGANKAFTGSRKNALTAALNLASDTADPDSYQPEEAVHRGAQEPAKPQVQYLTPDAWTAWKDVRDALRGTPEGKSFKAFCDDNSLDLTKPNLLTVGQGEALKAKAEALLTTKRARLANQPEGDGAGTKPTSDELRQAIKDIESAPDEVKDEAFANARAARDAQEARQAPPAPDVPAPGEAPEPGPEGTWMCNRCGVDVIGHLGADCPVCGKGELADLRDPEEPF